MYRRALGEALSRSIDALGIASLEIALAESLLFQRRFREAGVLVASVLGRHPDLPDARWSEARLSFYNQEPWPHPWENLEVRFGVLGHHHRLIPPGEEWDGTPLGGRTVLFAGEGGLGDQICFVRFVTLLKDAGAGRIIAAVHGKLIPLLSAAYPGVEFVKCAGRSLEQIKPAPAFDVGLSFMSAPRLLNLPERACPGPARLTAPPVTDEGRRKLAGGHPGALRVGVCWRATELARSIPARLFAALAELPGIQLFALLEPEVFAAEPPAFQIENLGEGQIAKTAAAIAELDLVITVDTMIAHLAGSLGKPVWVLANFLEDWRWCCQGETTPWYPTMQVMRRQSRGWEGLMERVRVELLSLAGARGSGFRNADCQAVIGRPPALGD